MKKIKKIFSLLTIISVLVLRTSPSQANAETATSDVHLTAEAIEYRVSVPSILPVTVDKKGVVTVATDAKIVNESAGAVQVKNVTVSPASGWTLRDYASYDIASTPVGSKTLAMKINNCGTTDGGFDFVESNFNVISGADPNTTDDELLLNYDVKVAARKDNVTNVEIAVVTFTIGWYE